MARKPRILCIDDLADNLRVRALLLQQFGCETFTASDHSSAMRIVADESIDLLLIDYHLANGETGEDIARDVCLITPHLPLVMLTGDVRLPDSARKCVDAVLMKGTSNPADLFDIIRRLLPEAEIRAPQPVLRAEKTW